MIAFGLVAGIAGIGVFCWLIFALAVHALPFFVALTVGFAAYHAGAGWGSPLCGFMAGAITLAAARALFAVSRSLLVRIVIALVFAAPAAIAGYQVISAMSWLGELPAGWSQFFAMAGSAAIALTATWKYRVS